MKDLMVFPAHAGVIPAVTSLPSSQKGLPRACGGDPYTDKVTVLEIMSSPRMRG